MSWGLFRFIEGQLEACVIGSGVVCVWLDVCVEQAEREDDVEEVCVRL